MAGIPIILPIAALGGLALLASGRSRRSRPGTTPPTPPPPPGAGPPPSTGAPPKLVAAQVQAVTQTMAIQGTPVQVFRPAVSADVMQAMRSMVVQQTGGAGAPSPAIRTYRLRPASSGAAGTPAVAFFSNVLGQQMAICMPPEGAMLRRYPEQMLGVFRLPAIGQLGNLGWPVLAVPPGTPINPYVPQRPTPTTTTTTGLPPGTVTSPPIVPPQTPPGGTSVPGIPSTPPFVPPGMTNPPAISTPPTIPGVPPIAPPGGVPVPPGIPGLPGAIPTPPGSGGGDPLAALPPLVRSQVEGLLKQQDIDPGALETAAAALESTSPQAAALLRQRAAELRDAARIRDIANGGTPFTVRYGDLPSWVARHYTGDHLRYKEIPSVNPGMKVTKNGLSPWRGTIKLPLSWEAWKKELPPVATGKAQSAAEKKQQRVEDKAKELLS